MTAPTVGALTDPLLACTVLGGGVGRALVAVGDQARPPVFMRGLGLSGLTEPEPALVSRPQTRPY